MSALYLRGVPPDALRDYWATERPAEATLQTTRGKWLRLEVRGGDPEALAETLSRDFAQEVRTHWEQNSAGASAASVFRAGKRVRRLVCAECRWVEVDGKPCRWESALRAPPRMGEEGPRQYELLDALDMNRDWGEPEALEGAPVPDGQWVLWSMVGGSAVVVVLIYLWLRSMGAPG